MRKYTCTICGYVYDEAKGMPEAGIAPGTRWEELPDDWVCPICGATKAEFAAQDEAPAPAKVPVRPREAAAPKGPEELNDLEKSALCSNLARGCEKQYLHEESELFAELGRYFKGIAAPAGEGGLEALRARIESDLAAAFPAANEAASADRGARRALVWSEKVTRILKSLLDRYAKEGEEMLRGVRVYVCTICGFVSVGEAPPAICPICKVPAWKFEAVEGR